MEQRETISSVAFAQVERAYLDLYGAAQAVTRWGTHRERARLLKVVQSLQGDLSTLLGALKEKL